VLWGRLEVCIRPVVVFGFDTPDDLPVYDGAEVCVAVGVVAEMQDFGFLCEPVQLFGQFYDLADDEDGRGTQGIVLNDIEEIIEGTLDDALVVAGSVLDGGNLCIGIPTGIQQWPMMFLMLPTDIRKMTVPALGISMGRVSPFLRWPVTTAMLEVQSRWVGGMPA
jgi:hypothetical protein